MKKLLITISLTISLIFSSYSTGWSLRIGFLDYSPLRHPAPDIKIENLERIVLEDGLDQYQTEAVVATLFEELAYILKYEDGVDPYQTEAEVATLFEELAYIFKYPVTKSHFIGECKDERIENCRHNRGFGISFKAQTKDINNDNFDDVIVELIHHSACGSGGCYQYIIMNNKGKWEAIGQSRSTYYLSKKDDNGKSTFYYADYCMLSPCIYYRLDLDNLN